MAAMEKGAALAADPAMSALPPVASAPMPMM